MGTRNLSAEASIEGGEKRMSTTADADAPRAPDVPAISLRGVSKHYDGVPALQPLDLEIREGEFFCLLGPSGCGKTTTLNLIGGFVAPTAGEIHIRNRRIDGLPPHRRDVNTVFQSYALFPHLSVRDNVEFGLRMGKVPRADARSRAAAALDLVDLAPWADRLPAQLSGGQQQRVAVARALVNRPAVLLLDEPLGALDLKLRRRLQVELAQIQREVGTTFVYVTHDQEEAMSMADRVAVMGEGRIHQLGTPEEIYRRPTSRYVAEFIGDSNFIASAAVSRELGGGGQGELVMVRPEAIQVGTPDEAPAHALAGRVLQTAFMGSVTRVTVECDASSGPVTAALQLDGGGAARFPIGSAVGLWWSTDAVVRVEDIDESSKSDKRGSA